MSVSGLCEICGQGEVRSSCDRCGKLACEEHYDRETGLCVECAAEVGRPGTTGEEDDWRDGVDTHRQ